MMTAVALVHFPALYLAIRPVPALGAMETIRPTPIVQGLPALFFISVLLMKLDYTETFLKLNRIPRHYAYPFITTA
jgi:hypothetical protein